jgi:hypothetical protein
MFLRAGVASQLPSPASKLRLRSASPARAQFQAALLSFFLGVCGEVGRLACKVFGFSDFDNRLCIGIFLFPMSMIDVAESRAIKVDELQSTT